MSVCFVLFHVNIVAYVPPTHQQSTTRVSTIIKCHTFQFKTKLHFQNHRQPTGKVAGRKQRRRAAAGSAHAHGARQQAAAECQRRRASVGKTTASRPNSSSSSTISPYVVCFHLQLYLCTPCVRALFVKRLSSFSLYLLRCMRYRACAIDDSVCNEK